MMIIGLSLTKKRWLPGALFEGIRMLSKEERTALFLKGVHLFPFFISFLATCIIQKGGTLTHFDFLFFGYVDFV